jgi:mRNA interferase YafQ
MRTIERTSQFKRDYKRLTKSAHSQALQTDFVAVLTKLADDRPLAAKYRDHALGGEWTDHRECHIKPDLLLIYRKPNEIVLQLVRIGSHSELGL